ncbi:major facilitator superfamily domain-containing protein 6 [Nilaparvata lugens]|uniref:major facilitator superfamily domain-containing protein 6 n=1 Tax=Nilaparvata lugens TaxID=108931 RepID=UPI00193DF538|nr:major facilitator superfamily domain-containing protein 6 [Nilaparvata lugens]
MPLCSARAELLPMKAHFFLFNAGTAPIQPFMPVYAKQLGFSSALVGTIYTILPFTGMLTKPIVGAISDRFRCHKLLFIISIVITIISFFAIMYIPPVEGKLIGEVHCTPVFTHLRFCPPPNRTDRYMVDKVMAEHKDNTSITCKMECIGTPEFTTEVCSVWGFKHYCSTSQPASNYIALAQAHALKEGLDPNIGKTAVIKSTTTPAPVTSLQDLKFEGALQPFHTQQVGGCLFIRMTGVRDLTSNDYQNEIAPSCRKPIHTTCKFVCDSPALVDIAEDRDLETPIIHLQFWALVACLVFSWMGMAAVVSIGDTICFGLLVDHDRDEVGCSGKRLCLIEGFCCQVGGCLFIRMTGVRDLTSNDYQNEIAPSCRKPIHTTCKFVCDSPALVDIAEDRDLETPIIHLQFWALVACLVFSWMGMAAVVSIGDTICFGLLGDKPSDYGYQRLWGSVGWGIFAILAGLLIDMFSNGLVLKNYTPVFYLMAVILIFNVAIATRIKVSVKPFSYLDDSRTVIVVYACIFSLPVKLRLHWFGMCTSLIWNFLFWHLETLAKGNNDVIWMKTLQGAIMAVQCFGGELPFFFISSWMLKKIGHVNAMSLVLFAFGVRFLLYSILVDPWWCLPIELLNGLTFGTFYATMASYASIIAPPGTEATIQGMVGAVFEGIGLSSGSFIGGLLFFYMDGAVVFRMYGLIVLSLCCIHICAQLYLGRHGSNIASTSGKEFNHSARYASPNDAISMLGDNNELTNS